MRRDLAESLLFCVSLCIRAISCAFYWPDAVYKQHTTAYFILILSFAPVFFTDVVPYIFLQMNLHLQTKISSVIHRRISFDDDMEIRRPHFWDDLPA